MSWLTTTVLYFDAVYFIEWDNRDVITSLFNVLTCINNITICFGAAYFLPVF